MYDCKTHGQNKLIEEKIGIDPLYGITKLKHIERLLDIILKYTHKLHLVCHMYAIQPIYIFGWNVTFSTMDNKFNIRHKLHSKIVVKICLNSFDKLYINAMKTKRTKINQRAFFNPKDNDSKKNIGSTLSRTHNLIFLTNKQSSIYPSCILFFEYKSTTYKKKHLQSVRLAVP